MFVCLFVCLFVVVIVIKKYNFIRTTNRQLRNRLRFYSTPSGIVGIFINMSHCERTLFTEGMISALCSSFLCRFWDCQLLGTSGQSSDWPSPIVSRNAGSLVRERVLSIPFSHSFLVFLVSLQRQTLYNLHFCIALH